MVDPISEEVVKSFGNVDNILGSRSNEIGDLLSDDGVLESFDHVHSDGGRDSPSGSNCFAPRFLGGRTEIQ